MTSPSAVAATATTPAALTGSGPAAARDRVDLPDGMRPEGITSGPGTRFYVGSLADGRIVTGDLRRGGTRVLLPGQEGRALRGLYFDKRSNLVWAVGQEVVDPAAGTPVGLILAVHAWTGRVVYERTVPDAAFLNDLVVTSRAAWVTDSGVDRLIRVPVRLSSGRPGSGALRMLSLTGDGSTWPTEGTIRANGIRELPDGTLVLDHSAAGGLWHVNPRSGKVSSIPVTGTPAIVGGDGLVLAGRTLYVVRGSGPADVTVVRLSCGHGGRWTASVSGVLTSPELDVPSTATLAGRFLWAVNARFGVPDPQTAPYWVTRLPLR